jgi:hypothetical protein
MKKSETEHNLIDGGQKIPCVKHRASVDRLPGRSALISGDGLIEIKDVSRVIRLTGAAD